MSVIRLHCNYNKAYNNYHNCNINKHISIRTNKDKHNEKVIILIISTHYTLMFPHTEF